jgi:hypothetical protein
MIKSINWDHRVEHAVGVQFSETGKVKRKCEKKPKTKTAILGPQCVITKQKKEMGEKMDISVL